MPSRFTGCLLKKERKRRTWFAFNFGVGVGVCVCYFFPPLQPVSRFFLPFSSSLSKNLCAQLLILFLSNSSPTHERTNEISRWRGGGEREKLVFLVVVVGDVSFVIFHPFFFEIPWNHAPWHCTRCNPFFKNFISNKRKSSRVLDLILAQDVVRSHARSFRLSLSLSHTEICWRIW